MHKTLKDRLCLHRKCHTVTVNLYIFVRLALFRAAKTEKPNFCFFLKDIVICSILYIRWLDTLFSIMADSLQLQIYPKFCLKTKAPYANMLSQTANNKLISKTKMVEVNLQSNCFSLFKVFHSCLNILKPNKVSFQIIAKLPNSQKIFVENYKCI